jgi:hypothetical protein
MGLPLSSDSSTASSRARSWTIRAIRNRYLARAAAGIGAQVCSYARRAAVTARSTSAGPASVTSASTSSVAGEMVLKLRPSRPGVNSPSMNSP